MNIKSLPLKMDEATEKEFSQELLLYGTAFLRVSQDGKAVTVEHVPLKDVTVRLPDRVTGSADNEGASRD